MWCAIRRGHQLIARVTPTAAVAVAGSRCSSNVAVAAAAMQHRRQSAAAAASQAVCFLPPLSLSLFPTTFATDSAAAAAEETAEEAVPCDLLAGLDIQAHVVKASRGVEPISQSANQPRVKCLSPLNASAMWFGDSVGGISSDYWRIAWDDTGTAI
eukprot:gene16087-26271_t